MLVLSLFVLTTLFGIYNPFDPFYLWKTLPPLQGSDGLTSFNEIIFAIFKINIFNLLISLSVIIVNIYLLFTLWNFEQKKERLFFFIMTFLLLYAFSISPNLYTFRLWSTDSAFHLSLINKFKQVSNYIPPKVYYQYGNFLYHKFFAHISNCFNINSHTLLLFLPQLLTNTIFFIGLYLLLFSKNNQLFELINDKRRIFVIILSHPLLLRYMSIPAPFNLVLAFAPLVIYFSLNIFEAHIYSLLLFLTIYLTINIHVYGYFYILVSIQSVFVLILFKYHITSNNITSFLLISNLSILITLIFLIFPSLLINMFITVFNMIPGETNIFIKITGSLDYGGKMLNYYFQIYSLYSYLKIFELILYFGPVLYIIVHNQYCYYKIYFNKKCSSKVNGLRLFCDVFFPSVILGYFFGEELAFQRMTLFSIFIYYILFLNEIIPKIKRFLRKVLHWFRKTVFREQYKVININKIKIFNKKLKIKENIFYVSVIIIMLLLPFIQSHPYSSTQYHALEWIKNNTPHDSTILTCANNFDSLTNAITGRVATGYSWILFDNDSKYDEEYRINEYIERFVDGKYLYLLLYFDRGHIYYTINADRMRVEAFFIHQYISNSSNFHLVYTNPNTEIYQIGIVSVTSLF